MALTVTSKRLATAMLSTLPQAIYTAPAGVTARIFAAIANNRSPNRETYTFWVPEGGEPADLNNIADAEPVGGGETAEVTELVELVIEPGWSLIGKASTDNALTIVISGVTSDDGSSEETDA